MEPEERTQLWSTTSTIIEKILNLNFSAEQLHSLSYTNHTLVWKVLILDDASNSALATIVHVGELRDHNIALHLSISAQREPLPEITAIYLVEPTPSNIEHIAADCRKQLYDLFSINFLYPASQETLSSLAAVLVAENALSKVHSVHQQHLKFTVLEDQLFTLTAPSFQMLEAPGKTDEEVENLLDSIATSLFCVLKASSLSPIICAGQGYSEIVASLLSEKCWGERDRISQHNRPLLLIVDRTIDLSVMLHHPWTYQGLVFDLLRNNLNRVVVPGDNPQVSELDPSKDSF